MMNVECVMGGERKWPRSFPTQPHVDDGQLEMLSFRTPFAMALVSGHVQESCAVGQYRNPTIIFRPNTTMAFQIDGEYYAGFGMRKMSVAFQKRILMVRLGKPDKTKIGNPTVKFTEDSR